MNTAKFDSYDERKFVRFSAPSAIERDLHTLLGVLNGINSDRIVNFLEQESILSWVREHRAQRMKSPYREVIQLIDTGLSDGILTTEEIENIIWYCNQYIGKGGYYNMVTSSIQQLMGIIQGISIDKIINASEIAYLDNWLETNEDLKNSWPYDEIYTLLTKISRDGIITPEEHDELLDFCRAVSGSVESQSNLELISTLKSGFCQIDPTIVVPESTFCITGLSKKMNRREIAEKIELYGGFVNDRVSSKINYLVVCDEKNSCWAFTCYGRKIEEAIKHRKNGINIVIVHEYDLYDTFESLN